MNAVKPGDANVAPDAWMAGIAYARLSANRHDPLVKLVVDRAVASRRPQ